MKLRKPKHSQPKNSGRLLINLLGILTAFGIAFGGLFLVQSGLDREQERLLAGSGLMELPRTGTFEAAEAGDVSLGRLLTEEELEQVRGVLETPGETVPHEPLSGQLSMIQAIECGRTWLEDFFLPHLGINDVPLQECKVNCYLWAPEAPGTETELLPWLSCWTVSLSSRHVEAVLILSAVSGQILEASVNCPSPVEYQEREMLMTLLGDFASSFGMNDDYCIVYSGETESGAKKLPWYQSVGTRGTFAAIQAASIATSADTDTGVTVYTEQFSIHLYLSSWPEAA